MDETASKEWKDVHETLQTSMKQEIRAMREMLANMHQEELSILAKDRKAWKQVMMDRVTLLSRLGELRTVRVKATKQLESLSKQNAPHAEEESCEILSMRDQLTALVEKMNEQNVRNQTLEASDIPSKNSSSYPGIPKGPDDDKKGHTRVSLATYPRHE